MNKFLARILGVSVGFAMAAGLGVGAVLHSKEFKKAEADSTVTYDLTKNFSTYASSWGTAYGSHTVTAANVGVSQ